MKKLFILKIGGSVATHKDNTEHTVRETLLREIFTILADAYSTRGFRLIIVHGAGGHIHHLAHEYKLSSGTCGNTAKEAGARHTQEAVTRLHREIVTMGTQAGLPLQSIPTHTVLTQHDKKIDILQMTSITQALSDGHIPVLSGDMVPDSILGMSICSGDALVSHLTTLLPVTHLLFATDVDGIYSEDPHINSEAVLLQRVTLEEIHSNATLGASHNKDTTGGLQGKIQSCMTLFNTSSTLEEIHLFNGLESENTKKIFEGTIFPHTCISA